LEILGQSVKPFLPQALIKQQLKSSLQKALQDKDKESLKKLAVEARRFGDAGILREALKGVSDKDLSAILNQTITVMESRRPEPERVVEREVTARKPVKYSGGGRAEISGTTAMSGGSSEISGTASGEQSVEAGGTVSVRQQANVSGSGSISANLEGQETAETGQTIKGQAVASVAAGSQGKVSGGLAAGQAGSGVDARAATTLSLQQSMDLAGEYLDKNPEIIPDREVRGKVQAALASGNLGNLDGEAQAALQKVLRPQPAGRDSSAEFQAAELNIANAMADFPKEPSFHRPGAAEEAQAGAGLAGKAAAGEAGAGSLPAGEVPQPEKSLPQQPFGETGAAVSRAAGPANLQGTGPEAGLEGSPAVQSRVSGPAGQGEAQSEVPPEFAKMIGGMKDKDRQRETGLPVAAVLQKTAAGQQANLPQPDLEQSAKGSSNTNQPAPFPEKRDGVAGLPADSPAGAPAENLAPATLPSERLAEQLGQTGGQQLPAKNGEKPAEGRGEAGQSEEDDEQDGEEDEDEGGGQVYQPRQGGPGRTGQSAEIKAVIAEASKMMNMALTQAANWVWGTALPSFGLSVLIGAVVGDFLWLFKTGIIKRFLNPLLKTQALKSKAEEIASQIKISSQVKFQILAMNLALAAVVLLALILVFGVVWTGCNYPVGKQPAIGYKLSVIGGAGYESICESMEGFTSATFGSGGNASGQTAVGNGSGKCSPVLSGPASVENLQTTCFGYNAPYASSIANAESGGNTFSASRSDICTKDGSVVSWGLFQINISAHKIGNLDCPKAFNQMFTAQTKNTCYVVNRDLYNSCVQAAKNPDLNIAEACRISGNGQRWTAWGANRTCGF
jgi:hypothetical protein